MLEPVKNPSAAAAARVESACLLTEEIIERHDAKLVFETNVRGGAGKARSSGRGESIVDSPISASV